MSKKKKTINPINIEKNVLELVDLEKQIKKLTDEYNTRKVKIQKYFDANNIDEPIIIEDKDSTKKRAFLVKKVERVYVDYNPEKLYRKLDKELYNEIVDKDYSIKDMNGLVKLLKKSGIKPKAFKKYIDTKVSVNKNSIKRLFSTGEITMNDLDGCYTSKIIKSVTIKEVDIVKKEGDTN